MLSSSDRNISVLSWGWVFETPLTPRRTGLDPRTTKESHMSLRTRRWPALAALAICVALVAASCNMNGQAWEASLLLNNERTDRGMLELTLEASLNAKAQAWAETMAAKGSVSHSNLADGIPAGWGRLGENVGWGRSVQEAHDLFMASPRHRAAILDPRFSSFGTGVSVRDGRYYVVQVFAG